MTHEEIASMFGDTATAERFGTHHSKAFARFIGGPGVNGSARLVSLHVSDQADTVVLEIDTVLPQYPLADIRESELIVCRFPRQTESRPEVLALRADFPHLPHQNLCPAGTPKSLCLDANTWTEAKHRWSPSSFLEAIRAWLAKATTGTLHAPGQPREPLIGSAPGYLILPSDSGAATMEKLQITGDTKARPMVFVGRMPGADVQPGKGKFKLVRFEMPAREHGVIESLPQNLAELEDLCGRVAFDLRLALTEKLQAEAPAGKLAGSEFAFNILLVLHQAVTGRENPEAVSHEEWAFMIGEASKIAEALGVVVVTGGMIARAILPQPASEQAIANLPVVPLAIFRRLDERRALAASGLAEPYPSVAVIGVGSLGSKAMEILARQGLSKAVLIDDDRLFPHNTGRHVLMGYAVGSPKASSMADFLAVIHDDEVPEDRQDFTVLEEKFALPPSDPMRQAFSEANWILDFSASVSVSRGVSSLKDMPRCFSAFLTPGADTLFVHLEDGERRSRLDWIEAITLRAIVEEPKLEHAYTKDGDQIWYGGPCREVSTILPNQSVTLFAAVCAGVFTRHHSSSAAKCLGYTLDADTMSLEAVEIEVTVPHSVESNGWTVKYDDILIRNLKSLRVAGFPNETGGVLLGILDREAMTCSVVIGSPSPPDSQAWPDSYIRGVAGLKDYVDRIGALTAGQLQYVGEWHSHPPGSSSRPSEIDREALNILTEAMGQEGLPVVTFIVAEDAEPHVAVGWLEALGR